jgi:hypothetical protein
MNAATAIDPRDYAIIRALGALSLGEPNIELAGVFEQLATVAMEPQP